MEERKNKSNVLIIILFILLLIAVGIICYLLGSSSVKESGKNSENTTEQKENSETSDDNSTEEETTITPTAYTPKCVDSFVKSEKVFTDIDETKYNNIIEYIQTQKDVQIVLNYCNDNPSTEEIEIDEYKLTDSEKNSVLNEIKSSTFSISEGGLGGVCTSSLEISYKRYNKEYYVSYYQLFAMSSNDGNIYKILDKSVDNKLYQPEYCFYNFENLSNTATSLEKKLTSN